MANKLKRLGIVVPCFNEEQILDDTFIKLKTKLEFLISNFIVSDNSFICFVDDGSKDTTWDLILNFTKESIVRGVKLSTNFGHQNALTAGMLLMKNESDFLITLDADLQDDIDVFEEMISKYIDGNLIVYGVREDRNTDSFFKRITAQGFYKLMYKMKIKSVYNHADFRLVDSRVLNELERFNEVFLFLRGIFPSLGFKSCSVFYTRKERLAGETKYPFRKMLSFAWNGITSFSTTPLKIIFYLGLFMFFCCIILGFWVLYLFLNDMVVKGWASSLLINLIFAGMNMISLGVIGEYVGKTYQEVKKRPRYIVETVL